MWQLVRFVFLVAVGYLFWRWYEHETMSEGRGTVRLQSEHEHFHMHVDLPAHMEIQPGDTLHVLEMPEVPESQTNGEVIWQSPIRLHKASWLRRSLVMNSSLIEVNELVEHP